ncbi:MAG TPA: PIG-L family deacetylase [Rudaea sp.]|nr:PIG-L family deacetylase [Rudaea sp.]
MSAQLEVIAADRVLVIAPHPDDESIATGGLLQLARNAGAKLRVIVLTDGDNNPWPQRWIEKHWHIDARDRARWGARRRGEAMDAMRRIGISDEQMVFLGMPDLGLTDLLMHERRRPIELLRDELEKFAPTLLVMPALSDRHPDHSAAHILVRLTFAQIGHTPNLFGFAVHGGGSGEPEAVAVLSDLQRDTKRAAILAHASQMRLSQRRFERYARNEETYWTIATQPVPDPHHPIQTTSQARALQVKIMGRGWRRSLRGHDLFIVLEGNAGQHRRWQVPLGLRKKTTPVYDAVSGVPTMTAAVTGTRRNPELNIALPREFDLRNGWIKIARPQPDLWVLDRCGWQVIAPAPTNTSTAQQSTCESNS